jgi:hypothetical protein
MSAAESRFERVNRRIVLLHSHPWLRMVIPKNEAVFGNAAVIAWVEGMYERSFRAAQVSCLRHSEAQPS